MTKELVTDLTAYYPFNGNANDESGNGYNGIVTGATLTTDRFGDNDKAYTFDGDDKIEKSGITNNPGNLTISTWFLYPAGAAASTHQIVDFEGVAAIALLEGSLQGVLNLGGNFITMATPVSSDQWHFGAITYEGTTFKLYLDGQLAKEIVNTDQITYNANSTIVRFGTNSDNSSSFTGSIDDARLYQRALSSAEVTELFNEGGWPLVSSENDFLTYGLSTGGTPSSTDFTLLGQFGSSRYYLSSATALWNDAKAAAESLGGHLAVVHSQEENDFISTKAGKAVWIGLTDKDSEGSFQWVDGSVFNFENWAQEEPNGNSSENFVEFRAEGVWNDLPDTQYPYVVELPYYQGVVDVPNKSIEVALAFGTDPSSLIASYTISDEASAKIGDAAQQSAVTPNDFSSDVSYTIAAEDESTQIWIVSVTESPNAETEMLTFSLPGETDTFTPNAINHTISIEVGSTTNLTDLIAIFTLSEGASATINGTKNTSESTSNDFSVGVTYLITAQDGKTTQNWTVTVTVSEDGESPVISNITAPTPYIRGSGGTAISASVADNVGVSSVKLFHKKISAPDFTESKMELSNNSYSTALVDANFGSLGLEFYIEAKDAANNTTTSSVSYVYASFANGSQTITGLKAGTKATDYSIIAIPYSTVAINTIFDGIVTSPHDKSKWRLLHYNGTSNTEYPSLSNFEPGKGYWFLNSTRSSITLGSGHSVQAHPDDLATITLRSGQNMIGNPYPFAINWDDVIAYNKTRATLPIISTDVDAKLTKYSSGYTASSSLAKFEGAFVKATKAVTLEIPIPANADGGRIRTSKETQVENNIIGSDAWTFNLDVFNESYQYRVSEIGMRPDAILGEDNYDMIRLPRFEKFVDISFENDLTRSIVPNEESFVWKFNVNSTYPDEHNTLTWDRERISNSEYGMLLLDVSAQRIVDMSDEDSHTFEVPNENKQFELYYGLKSGLYGMLNPESNFLGNPYPNPTSKGLTIPLTISDQQTEAQIQIIDLFGKVVHRYESGSFSQGYHEIEINELFLRSGTYIMRVEFHGGDKVEVFNKKLFLKK